MLLEATDKARFAEKAPLKQYCILPFIYPSKQRDQARPCFPRCRIPYPESIILPMLFISSPIHLSNKSNADNHNMIFHLNWSPIIKDCLTTLTVPIKPLILKKSYCGFPTNKMFPLRSRRIISNFTKLLIILKKPDNLQNKRPVIRLIFARDSKNYDQGSKAL